MGISLDDLVDLCKEFGFDVFPGSEGVRMIVLPGDLQQQSTMGNHVSFIFRGYNFWGLKSYFLPTFSFIFRGYNPYLLGVSKPSFLPGFQGKRVFKIVPPKFSAEKSVPNDGPKIGFCCPEWGYLTPIRRRFLHFHLPGSDPMKSART